MDPQAFQLLMDRFDTIEKQNDAQIHLMTAHKKDDDDVHIVVTRHSTYWTLVVYIVGAIIATGASVAVAFIH